MRIPNKSGKLAVVDTCTGPNAKCVPAPGWHLPQVAAFVCARENADPTRAGYRVRRGNWRSWPPSTVRRAEPARESYLEMPALYRSADQTSRSFAYRHGSGRKFHRRRWSRIPVSWLIARQDPMLPMTVGAYRSVPYAARNRFAVDALAISGENSGVALAASFRNFPRRNPEIRIVRGENIVRAMTIGADGSRFPRRRRGRGRFAGRPRPAEQLEYEIFWPFRHPHDRPRKSWRCFGDVPANPARSAARACGYRRDNSCKSAAL